MGSHTEAERTPQRSERVVQMSLGDAARVQFSLALDRQGTAMSATPESLQ